jgi:hypothetical protein
MATAEDKMTSVTLPRHVRDRLRDYQVGGKTASQAIEERMDEVPPDYFRRDLQRALLLPGGPFGAGRYSAFRYRLATTVPMASIAPAKIAR